MLSLAYFPPGLRSPSQPKTVTVFRPVPSDRGTSLSGLNPRRTDGKSNSLPLCYCITACLHRSSNDQQLTNKSNKTYRPTVKQCKARHEWMELIENDRFAYMPILLQRATYPVPTIWIELIEQKNATRESNVPMFCFTWHFSPWGKLKKW